MRDKGQIRPPSGQLFERNNFGIHDESRKRPLNWSFGLILKILKVALIK